MPRKPKNGDSHAIPESQSISASHTAYEAPGQPASQSRSEAHTSAALSGLAQTKLVVRRLYDGQKLRIQGDLRFQRLEREGLLHLIPQRCPLCAYGEDGELLAHCVHHHELDELDKRREAVFRGLKKEHKGSKAEFLLIRARDAEQESEKWYERIVADDINDLPVWAEYLLHVKGIGPRLAGLLIANIAPIARFPNVAKLWAYCGLHVVKEDRIVILFGTNYLRADLKLTTDITQAVHVTDEQYKRLVTMPEFKSLVASFSSSGQPFQHVIVVDPIGVAAKRKTGEKANWSNELKTTAFKIADSFIKSGSPYRALYDEYKARIIDRETKNGNTIYRKDMKKDRWIPISRRIIESQDRNAISHSNIEPHDDNANHQTLEAQNSAVNQGTSETPTDSVNQKNVEDQPGGVPEWTLGRINNMARRYMVKMFLSHLWAKWRELEGLEVTMPYALSLPGHTHYKRPEDYMGKPKWK